MAPLKMGMVGGGLDALVGAWRRDAGLAFVAA